MIKKLKRNSEGSEGTDKKVTWTFLSNYTHVLYLISEEQELVLREIGIKVGITERAVQRIVADLEEEGFIVREKVGRKNTYQLNLEKTLRHPLEKHCSIGTLVRCLKPK
jgi:uncharacterized membrane protein